MTSTSDSTPKQPHKTLVADLQSALLGRRPDSAASSADPNPAAAEDAAAGGDGSEQEEQEEEEGKAVVLVTNAEGIRAPGLSALVDALVRGGHCDVFVCAPDSDKSASGHSVTVRETVAATSFEMNGATAFEVSGTAADCVSLALSGALFAWSRPALVISGINQGPVCGHQSFYSGAVAGAREALLCGIPSVAISLDWKKDGSQESDFKVAVDVCIPLIHAAIRDVAKGLFPKNCILNIGIPSSPSTNKGFKLTRQSFWRSAPNWQAVSANRNPAAAQFMSMHQSLGIQLAQLGRDASAAGAARRISAQRKNVEIESVAAAGKPETLEVVKKFFRLEFLDDEQEELDEDLDFRALEHGFVTVTPLHLQIEMEPKIQESASDWLSSLLEGGDKDP